MARSSKPSRAELEAQLRLYTSGLAAGRILGAQTQQLAAAIRQAAIERAVGDLVANPESSKWRVDAMTDFLFSRQSAIGLRPHYSRSSLDRRVRRALRKLRAASACQSLAKSGETLAA